MELIKIFSGDKYHKIKARKEGEGGKAVQCACEFIIWVELDTHKIITAEQFRGDRFPYYKKRDKDGRRVMLDKSKICLNYFRENR